MWIVLPWLNELRGALLTSSTESHRDRSPGARALFHLNDLQVISGLMIAWEECRSAITTPSCTVHMHDAQAAPQHTQHSATVQCCEITYKETSDTSQGG